MGSFVHACEGEMVCESINPKIPYFNAPIYLENKVRSIQSKYRRTMILIVDRLPLAKSMKSWAQSTSSFSPSNLKKA